MDISIPDNGYNDSSVGLSAIAPNNQSSMMIDDGNYDGERTYTDGGFDSRSQEFDNGNTGGYSNSGDSRTRGGGEGDDEKEGKYDEFDDADGYYDAQNDDTASSVGSLHSLPPDFVSSATVSHVMPMLRLSAYTNLTIVMQ
jgi:hypothetical protein